MLSYVHMLLQYYTINDNAVIKHLNGNPDSKGEMRLAELPKGSAFYPYCFEVLLVNFWGSRSQGKLSCGGRPDSKFCVGLVNQFEHLFRRDATCADWSTCSELHRCSN